MLRYWIEFFINEKKIIKNGTLIKKEKILCIQCQ